MTSTESSGFRGPLAGLWPRAATALGAVPLRGETGIPPAADRLAWGRLHGPTLAAIEARARPELGTPWPQPLASQYARYFRDGNRTDYEGTIAARQQRLSRATVMAAVTADQRWLDEVADGVAVLCEQSSWSWAAHDDTFTVHGHVVPTASSPYLDLGAGEVAAQLAWIDAVLGLALDERIPGLVERMRHETAARVLDPFLARRDWHWLGLNGDVNNWNPWIHGNIIVAALRLVADPARRAATLALAVEGIDRYLAALPDDGAIDEGFSYWWNGACRALEALDTLRIATGGALDATGIPVLHEVLRFPSRMQLAGTWYVNVADGSARAAEGLPWRVPFHWGTLIGDAEVVAHATAQRRQDEPVTQASAGLGRMLHALFDDQWVRAKRGRPPLPARTWLASTGMLVARETDGDPDALTVAVKGGHNGEHHNHKDLGGYIVAVDGRPLMVDAGQPTYTAQTFGPDRYGIRAMQSGWHSTPAPWGLEQGSGAEFAAEVERIEGGRDADLQRLVLRLERAYPLPRGSSWRRSVALDRPRQRIIATDEWELPAWPEGDGPTQAGHGILLHQLVHGEVCIHEDAAEIDDGAGAPLLLRWQSGALVTARVETWELDDPLLRRVWGERLRRLTLRLDADPLVGSHGALTLTIERQA